MSLEDDILIDDYLRGNLSDAEMSEFEKRLSEDQVFKENFDLEKKLWQSQDENGWSFVSENNSQVKNYKALLSTKETADLKKKLTEIDSKFEYKSSNSKSYHLLYYIAAASLLLFLGFQFFNNNSSNEELFQDYLNKADLPSFVSRNSDSSTSNLAEAQHLFENENYEKALVIFNAEVEASENKAAVLIYKGLSEIQLSKYKLAEKTFNDLIKSDLLDAEKGYWYKALLHLKLNDIEKTKKVLNDIILNSYYNSEKAKVLLEELK